MLSVDGSMLGDLKIGGLPFKAAGPPGLPAVVILSASGVAHASGYSEFHGLIAPGSSVIDILEAGSAVPRVKVTSAGVRPGAEFMLSTTYVV
jgi:hypothetical protein